MPSDEAGFRRYERPEQLPPDLRSTRYYLFPGGCVTYEFAFDSRARRVADLRRRQRARLPAPATLVARCASDDLTLCGAGHPRVRRIVTVTVISPVGASKSSWGFVVAIVVAVLTTALSLRLLGIRRGWITALLAGLHRLGHRVRSSHSGSTTGTGAPTG